MKDSHEWECPECGQIGNYADIRRVLDSGGDRCPDCRSPVECCDDHDLTLEQRGFVSGATVRQYHHATLYDDAIILFVHPNGALDVEIDGEQYGWSSQFCEVVKK